MPVYTLQRVLISGGSGEGGSMDSMEPPFHTKALLIMYLVAELL